MRSTQNKKELRDVFLATWFSNGDDLGDDV